MYYERHDVRQAIMDYANANGSTGGRECAFYNARAKSIQRYIEDGGSQVPISLTTPAGLNKALNSGASAFYCSYWRQQWDDPAHPMGRDLVWTTRARQGGLKFAKEVTAWTTRALEEAGISKPWVKYSGELGFDLVIPLEAIPCESLNGGIESLRDLQEGLTSYIVSYIRDWFPDVLVDGASSSIEIKREKETCLLSELRARRGLLLAPMSLSPQTGLVSVTVDPRQVERFSVYDASPEDARGVDWKPPADVANNLIRSVQPIYSALAEKRQAET